MRSEIRTTGLAVLLSAACLASTAYAQTVWWRNFGGLQYSEGTSVQPTNDGGYIVTGYTYAFGGGSADVWLIKTDAQGDTAWARTYGSSDYERGNSVQQTADGGYVIAGYVWRLNQNTRSIYLIKADVRGDTVWTRTYGATGYDEGNSVEQTSDGGYIIAGKDGWSSIYLIKTDSLGDTLWTRTHTDGAVGNSVHQTSDGGYVVAGLTTSHACLLKTDAQGDRVWAKSYTLLGYDPCFCVQQTSDGGYILTGQTEPLEQGTCRAYLIRTNSQGDTLWTRTYGDSCHHGATSVQQTSDGGYVAVGWTYSAGWLNQIDVYLVRTDAQGDTLWTKNCGGRFFEEGDAVRQTADGGYIISGYTFSFGLGYGDVYLIKTDSAGNVVAVGEDPKPKAVALSQAPTVLSGASGARHLASCVAFDAMGRRVLPTKPGIYFLSSEATAPPRKVLLVR